MQGSPRPHNETPYLNVVFSRVSFFIDQQHLDNAHDPAQVESSTAWVTYDFGARRRIYPGMNSAKQSLLLGLAKAACDFYIVPIEGKDIHLDLETGFVQEIALHPKYLDIALELRDRRTKEGYPGPLISEL
ncbi:cytochrome P450 3 monooxygenase [Penicillium hordei]|uniref:Cytochrome P450 3 monooxygenase n=1 Tax=Penicillium hordei TaxID=40994 RepID=A0AAD6E5G5_9EURO|nr:cytochrome P450 3 monooxygenase [Penicillium hordei]KAJ5602414.1 cytochrome P450 3 monooxygenase [Penicillium hordei]